MSERPQPSGRGGHAATLLPTWSLSVWTLVSCPPWKPASEPGALAKTQHAGGKKGQDFEKRPTLTSC